MTSRFNPSRRTVLAMGGAGAVALASLQENPTKVGVMPGVKDVQFELSREVRSRCAQSAALFQCRSPRPCFAPAGVGDHARWLGQDPEPTQLNQVL